MVPHMTRHQARQAQGKKPLQEHRLPSIQWLLLILLALFYTLNDYKQ